MDPIDELVRELEGNPRRFRATGGYERLLGMLRKGYSGDAVKRALGEDRDLAADLLWTVAELESVTPYTAEAAHHISSDDKARAAYAMEIVLRGARDPAQLRAALAQLRSSEDAVCEHAVRVLAGQGLTRVVEILTTGGGAWRTVAADLSRVPLPPEVIEGLVRDPSRDRRVVGVALATLACEQDARWADWLSRINEDWIRDYGEWLLQTRYRRSRR